MSSRSEDGQVLARESYPEPKTKAGIASLIREILDTEGAVERIILEKGHPVRAWRWVDKEGLMDDELTLDGALRNAEILEYSNTGEDATPFEIMFDMIQTMRNMEHAFPVCWATGMLSNNTLDRWLRLSEHGKPYDLGSMSGIPVQRLKSLPEDTLLLCGAPFTEAEGKDVTIVIKTALEVRRRNEQVVNGDAYRSRGHSQERRPANGEMAHRRGRNGGQGWQPSSFIRARLGSGSKIR